MSDELFDVVFFGIIQTGKDKEAVKQNMAQLFKTDAQKLTPYFSGGRKVIKGKINAEAAGKYKAALENVGLVIAIEACSDTPADSPQQTNAEASDKSKNPAQSKNSNTDTSDIDTGNIDTGGITVAPVGSDVIENPVAAPAQKIDDISSISMAEAGADVIENPAPKPVQKIDDISDISMAEVGSDVLDHPVEVIPQKIDDISDLSLAEAGADIIENPKPKEKADIPDISELELK